MAEFTKTHSILYAVAYETWDQVGSTQINLKGDIQYERAQSIPEARKTFLVNRPHILRKLDRKRARIVAIGPVLGYYVEDKDEKILSV